MVAEITANVYVIVVKGDEEVIRSVVVISIVSFVVSCWKLGL